MRRISLAVLVVGAMCAIGGGAAVPANADICAISDDTTGNFNSRSPDTTAGTCGTAVTVGTGKYIKVLNKGNLISSGLACAQVSETKKGNYSDLACTTKVTPGTGSYALIKTTKKAEEHTARWKVNGTDAGTLKAEVKISKLTTAKATLKSKIGGTEVKFNTTTTPELIGVSLEGGGTLTTGGKVKFTGVSTELASSGKESIPCKPLGTAGSDPTLGIITSSEGKGGIKLHEGNAVTYLLPKTGTIFGKLFFGEECSLPEEVPIITKAETGNGLVITDPLGVGNELVEHEITELAALTELWVISETAEHKATIEGKAGVILTGGTHTGLKWRGEPDLFDAS
jgi:hypothetical protein